MYKDIAKSIKKSEKTYSEQQVAEMITELVLKKSKEYPETSVEDLSKGFKDAFKTGLTVLGLIHGANALYQQEPAKKISPEQKISEQKQIQQARSDAKKQGQDILSGKSDKNRQAKIDGFLKAVSMNESSGGKNLKHKQMKHGIHAGDSAIGEYAFMPNTVKDIVGTLDKKNPLRNYSKMSNKKIQEQLAKNPAHQKELATHLANRLHDRFDGDENKMAFAYNQGHNISIDNPKFTSGEYQKHPYVQKYNKHKQAPETKQPIQNPAQQKRQISNTPD